MFDPLVAAAQGDPDGPPVYAVSAQLRNAIVQLAHLLDGLGPLSLVQSAEAVVGVLAEQLTRSSDVVDLSDIAMWEGLLREILSRTGISLDDAGVRFAAQVVAAASQAVGEIVATADEGFLEKVERVKATAQGPTVADIQRMTQGNVTPEYVFGRWTGSSLRDEIAAVQVGSVLPVELTISDVVFLEGTNGVALATFHVQLSRAGLVPITVDFATVDATASANQLDYAHQQGSLRFEPGQTDKAITVPVLGDPLLEADEQFFLELRNPVHAMLAGGRAVATILNDDTAQQVLGLSATTVVIPDERVELFADLTDQVQDAATLVVDWGDGSIDVLEVAPRGGLVLVGAAYTFDESGEYIVSVSLPDTDGKPGEVLRTFAVTVQADQDGDGVSDQVEDSAADAGDGNRDGIPDRQQSNVTSVRHPKIAASITLIAPDSTALVNVQFDDLPRDTNEKPADSATLPFGFMKFGVLNVPQGGSVEIVVLVNETDQRPNAYFQFGTRADGVFDAWRDLRFGAPLTVGAARREGGFVLHLADGQAGDQDAEVNGIISHAGTAAIDRLAFQNPSQALDVNNDGVVVPNDVLRIFNQLNEEGAHELRDLPADPPADHGRLFNYVDVNGDGFLTPNDALQLINFLHRQSESAEGEAASLSWDANTLCGATIPIEKSLGFALQVGPRPGQDDQTTLRPRPPRKTRTEAAINACFAEYGEGAIRPADSLSVSPRFSLPPFRSPLDVDSALADLEQKDAWDCLCIE